MERRACVLILFVLLFAGCSSQPNPPAATITPTQPPVQNKSVNSLPKEQPTPTTPVAVKKTTDEGSIKLPEVDPLEVEGDINIAGSSTVFPLLKTIYDRFIEEGYGNSINIESVSSTAGLKLFCQEGKADIANSTRRINNEEVKACAAKGRTPIEFRVGTDALVVAVNKENDFLTNVTLKELAAIFTAEKWSDVNPKWPNERIKRFVRDTESVSFNFFVERVFNNDIKPLLNSLNTKFSRSDGDLIDGVIGNKYAISFFSYAYYPENAQELKVLSIEGIAPNAESAKNGKYLLNRPIFLYSDANIISKKPQVAAFINFYLTHVNEEIVNVGYFPPSQKELDEAKVNLLKAMGLERLVMQTNKS